MTVFWRRWLMGAAVASAAVGLGFATLATAGATGAHNALFDLVYLPGELEAPAGDVASFAMGVTGAVMVGWSTTILVLLRDRTASFLPTTWRAITFGLLVWFVVDGSVSIAAGATGNLVLNAVFLSVFAPGLIATRPGRVPTPRTPRGHLEV